jgi:hypothetical protein
VNTMKLPSAAGTGNDFYVGGCYRPPHTRRGFPGFLSFTNGALPLLPE